MDLAAGTLLGSYEILSPLGAGGMGEVYLAADTRLDRRVALKILPENFAGDTERMRRFVQEAKSASALNHPNIITIYEIGESDDRHYIATEYIEGQTLRHRIQLSRLKIREVLDVLVQVASALATAHQAGIIHRDVKPENVMLRPDGYVKVLDFGLAKLTEKQALTTNSDAATISGKATDPGTIMGTAQYMSPEQARGRTVDARTDIFSLGIVLYEMIAGRPPFAGESSADVLSAILDKEPLPLLRFVDDLPQELQRIVTRCLRKECDERYQTMKDVLLDVKELRDELALEAKLERSIRPASNSAENQQTLIAEGGITQNQVAQATSATGAQTKSSAEYVVSEIRQHKRGVTIVLLGLLIASSGMAYWYFSNRSSSARPIESIAVMPFVNESGNQEVEYLSDGMTETLISSLSNLPSLNVKPRSTVFRYKGKETDPQTIGKELNVQAILNGRVVRRAQDISLFVELIDISLDKVIWSQQYNRKQSDLVTLQTDIAHDVSSKLKSKLSGADEIKVSKSYTTNPKALEHYLKGRYLSRQFTLDGFNKGVDAFNQAIAIDPNYALAYAGLSDAYFYASTIHLPPTEALPKVGEFAEKARAIDESLAAAHHSIANYKANFERDNPGAKREFERALELDPNDLSIYFDYSQLLSNIGESEPAVTLARRAKQIDTQDASISYTLAQALILSGRYDEGLEEAKTSVRLDDKNWWGYYWSGVAYSEKGMHNEAITALQTAAALDDSSLIRGVLACALARAGRRAEAQHIVDELIIASKSKFVSQSSIAMGYGGLGEKDKAFEWLGKSLESHDEQIVWIFKHPMFAPLRNDPRFKDLLKRVNLPE